MSRCLGCSVKALALAFVFGMSPAFADSGAEGVENLEGFFIGVDAACSHLSLKNDETEGVFTLYDDSSKMSISKLGRGKNKRVHVDPSVNIGYSHFFGNWYLGLAGDVSFGNNRKSFVITDPDDDEGYETKIGGVSYGLKAKGGCYLGKLDSVVYGIAGVKWRDISYKKYNDGLLSSKTSLKGPFFLLGLGFERPICKKLSLSSEYEYSWRSSTGGIVSKVDGVGFASFGVEQKLHEHTLKVGIRYRI